MKQGLFSSIRTNHLLNALVRNSIRTLLPEGSWVGSQLRRRWRVSGTLDLNVNGKQFRYYSKADDGVADALFYNPERYYEYQDLLLFSELALYTDSIFDIGANTGIYSVLASLSNPDAMIYAFEPFSINHSRLLKNLALNSCKNVKPLQMAAGESNATLTITVPEDDMICDVISANEEFSKKFYRKTVSYKNIEVAQTTLDNFIKQHHVKNPGLIKIDVESYEIPVFKGMKQLLENSKPVILCEIFIDEVRDRFYEEQLKPLGYYFYMHTEDGIKRVESIMQHQKNRNFIFSPNRSSKELTPYSAIQQLAGELMGKERF